jgi:MSHA biogenesis protein MshI
MVIALNGAELALVHGEHAPDRKPQIHQYAVRAVDADHPALDRTARELGLGRFDCATLLDPGDYQIVVVEAPNVPREELRTAIRWRVKDLLDFHVDDATLDVLDIPVPKDGPSRAHTMYAVAARNEAVERRVRSFEEAAIPLSVIDIPETSQRNIAALYESPGRGLALLHFDAQGGLLTLNYEGELYMTRRLDVHTEVLSGGDAAAAEEARARVLLELQRSLDHFERQFRWITLDRLLLGPEAAATGLGAYLRANMDLPVDTVDLNAVLAVSGGPMDASVQARLFHLLGAALRHETRAL